MRKMGNVTKVVLGSCILIGHHGVSVMLQSDSAEGMAELDFKNVHEPALTATQEEIVLPLSVKKSAAWFDIKNRIANAKENSPSMRPHFCCVCGLIASDKSNLVKHAKRMHKKSHPDFDLHDAFPLKDVEQYYRKITTFKNPCSEAKNFIKKVHEPVSTITKQKALPPCAKKSAAWRDVKKRIDSAKEKISSKRPHFCYVCGLIASEKRHLFLHAKTFHNKSHPDFDLHDALPLKDVEQYYYSITAIESPCSEAKYFMKKVQEPVPTIMKKKALPPSVKTSAAWQGIRAKIEKAKEKRPSIRPHFCPLCGFIANQKAYVFTHAKDHHKKTHPDFHQHDAMLLTDVEQYYHTIKGFKHLHEIAQHFVTEVNSNLNSTSSEPPKNQSNNEKKRKKQPSTQNETQPLMNRKHRRKHMHPRQLPPSVTCTTRYHNNNQESSPPNKNQQVVHIPLGCENENIAIKTEPQSGDDDDETNIKIEPDDKPNSMAVGRVEQESIVPTQPDPISMKSQFCSPRGTVKTEHGIKREAS